jgi:hypothetical protein
MVIARKIQGVKVQGIKVTCLPTGRHARGQPQSANGR